MSTNSKRSGEALRERGLHFLCNTMTNGKLYDIAAIKEGSLNVLIRQDQGELNEITGTFDAAGNSFSYTLPQSGSGDVSDFRSDSPSPPPIDYHYFNQGQEKAMDIDPLKINTILTDENTCEIQFSLDFTPIYDLNTVKSDFYSDKSAYYQAESDYEDAVMVGDASLAEQKLFEMKVARIGMDEKAQIILKDLILDTLTYSKDSINTWWANIDRYETDVALAQNYLTDNQINDALLLLNNAYTKYNLSTEQTNDLNDIISIYQLLQQKTLDGLDVNDLDNLKLIADDIYTVSSASLAKSILRYHGHKLFPPVYFLPSDNNNARLGSEKEEKIPFDLFIQPNPADNYIEFRWTKLPESPSVRLFNAVGKLMWEGNLSDNIDYFHLNTDFLQSGIYFYQLYSKGKPTYLNAGKLIIQKR